MTRFVKVTGHALLLVEGQRGRWAFLCECGSVQTYLATQHDAIAAHRDHKVAVRTQGEAHARCH